MADGARHDADLALWAAAQARLLREERLGEVDAPHLADALEALARRQHDALLKGLTALLVRLLLWKYMPGARLPSWRSDVAVERRGVAALIAVSPSLAAELPPVFEEAYRLGRLRAAAETGIDVGLLPETAPFTLAEAREESFLPLEPGLEYYADHHRADDHVADDFLY